MLGDGLPAVRLAIIFGWDLERPVTVLVAELDPEGDERTAQDRLVTCWTATMRRHDQRGAVAGFSHEVVAVLDAAVDADRVAKDAAAAFADVPPATFSTGTSRPCQGAETLPEAYSQALKAARVGRQLHGAARSRTSTSSASTGCCR